MAQLFEPAHALKSMRKNSLSCYAAFGEVLDNSIQAEADNIFVEFEPKKVGQKARLAKAVFIDNGCGMDSQKSLQGVLQSALAPAWVTKPV